MKPVLHAAPIVIQPTIQCIVLTFLERGSGKKKKLSDLFSLETTYLCMVNL